MGAYTADTLYTTPQAPAPTGGRFLIPVCTDADGLAGMLNALYYARGVDSGDPDDLQYMGDFLEALAFLQNPGGAACLDLGTQEPGDCLYYPASSPIVQWRPYNPFLSTPDGIGAVAWRVSGGGPVDGLLGLRAGDVVATTFDVGQAVRAGFRVKCDNADQVELHLLNIVNGGVAVMVIDDDILTATTIDLNKDLAELPPETLSEIVVEHMFDTRGPHHIDVTLFPTLNDSAIPIAYGGGLRGVVLCGTDISTGGGTLRFKVENCQLFASTDDGVNWTMIFDPGACAENRGIDDATASALPNGYAPTATITGTTTRTLELGIPAGAPGLDGLPGIDGMDGVNGTVIDFVAANGRPEGSAPTVELDHDDMTGENTLIFGIPVGATGATGAEGPPGISGIGFDTLPPEYGELKTYSMLIDADGGGYLPFTLDRGDTVQSITAQGLWGIAYPLSLGARGETVSDMNGTPVGLLAELSGDMRYALGANSGENISYTDYPLTALPVELDVMAPTLLKLYQHRPDTGSIGRGSLLARVAVRRAGWVRDYQFTLNAGNQLGWYIRPAYPEGAYSGDRWVSVPAATLGDGVSIELDVSGWDADTLVSGIELFGAGSNCYVLYTPRGGTLAAANLGATTTSVGLTLSTALRMESIGVQCDGIGARTGAEQIRAVRVKGTGPAPS